LMDSVGPGEGSRKRTAKENKFTGWGIFVGRPVRRGDVGKINDHTERARWQRKERSHVGLREPPVRARTERAKAARPVTSLRSTKGKNSWQSRDKTSIVTGTDGDRLLKRTHAG